MGTRRQGMQKTMGPILTIGMIFKNEIRCLERCMRSLDPLRKAVSCELIMADTGSNDGSREVAARYADILFDFPWIDDFSAARNAVMDRASGQWYLSIDADEYLDSDISQLVEFLRTSDRVSENVCGIRIRNYTTSEIDGNYADFIAVRMLRMSTGLRFEGAIHEAWPLSGKRTTTTVHSLSHTILHHDGYVNMNNKEGDAKRNRNISLLRKELEKEPERLRSLMQYIESGRKEDDYLEIIKRAVAVVEAKKGDWKKLGPVIFRYALRTATEKELPEYEEWLTRAEELFPDSLYTKIDIEYIAFIYAMEHKSYREAVHRGERYLNDLEKYRKSTADYDELLYGSLLMEAPYWEQNLKIYLSSACIKEKKPERARELLESVDGTFLDAEQTKAMLCILGDLHAFTCQDTAEALSNFFRGIGNPKPSKKLADMRLEVFSQTALLAFSAENQMVEQLDSNYHRLGYTLFLPLYGQCEAGRAAAVMASDDPDRIRLLLENVKKWEEFPIEALRYALEKGLSFPLPEKMLTLEEMDSLAGRLAMAKGELLPIIWKTVGKDIKTDWQALAWARGLALSAIRTYNWEQESSEGLALARFFAQVEEVFLPRYYGPELLCKENLALLPLLHRFGWHCVNAFSSLNKGNITGYVHELHAGLDTCKEMKPMVEYLTEHTPELSEDAVPAELTVLAKQVRTLLSAYPSDSPEVAALKSSPAYQKVAWLIEKKEELDD